MKSERTLKSPSRVALAVESEFRASHTLEGFEIPHFHLWKVQVEFAANLPLPNDRVLDLVFLQSIMHKILEPTCGAHLNTTFDFSPTTENIALWIWEALLREIPDAPLNEVCVSICDLEGRSTGAARVIK